MWEKSTRVVRSGRFRQASDKTEHRDKDRIILIGPKGQAVLREFLSEALAADLGRDAFVFSPVDAEAERNRPSPARCAESAMTPSQATRARRPDPAAWARRPLYDGQLPPGRRAAMRRWLSTCRKSSG